MSLKKLILKVESDISSRVYWSHFCYVDEILYNEFLHRLCESSLDVSKFLSDWTRKDFGKYLDFSSQADIYEIKDLVKEEFKRTNPRLYLASKTDRQGYLRAWVTKHMVEELGYEN